MFWDITWDDLRYFQTVSEVFAISIELLEFHGRSLNFPENPGINLKILILPQSYWNSLQLLKVFEIFGLPWNNHNFFWSRSPKYPNGFWWLARFFSGRFKDFFHKPFRPAPSTILSTFRSPWIFSNSCCDNFWFLVLKSRGSLVKGIYTGFRHFFYHFLYLIKKLSQHF